MICMKYFSFHHSIILCCFLLFVSCIEPYPPPSKQGSVNFLVVDGSANSTEGTVQVKLSRAVSLSSKNTSPPESGALVRLEDNKGNTQQLNETEKGNYQQSNLLIDASKAYRLYIKTAEGNEYQSDFVTQKYTPEIDSVTWAPSQTRDGIDIFVNTHDDKNKTRYYQWSFEETYQYQAPYYSFLKILNKQVVPIPDDELTYNCWTTLPSQKILVGSSENLSQDIIYHFRVNKIPKGSQKLSVKYSILVKQRALSRDAYDYWLNLQKTTEHLGSLFDPQPGQVEGNIHNLNVNSAPALGYFDVGSTQVKRIFIRSSEIPLDISGQKSFNGCILDTVLVADLPNFDTLGYALVQPLSNGPATYAYTYSSLSCTDCRYQKGKKVKPIFWE